ncbi:MAG: LamG domain-containing protein, partial [Cyclobacteriaceae bacterium]
MKSISVITQKALTLLGLFLIFSNLNAQNFALDFDGSDDVLSITDDPALQPAGNFTLEAWIYPTNSTKQLQRIISKFDGSSAGNDSGSIYWDVFDGSGALGLRAGIANSGDVFTTTPTTGAILTLNTWQHVALVFDQGVFTIYLNGVSQISADLGETSIVDNAVDWGIGGEGNSAITSAAFDGLIDEVRIWHSARTPEQLIAFKDVELNGGEPGLAAYYNFSDGAGDDTVPDVSGNGNAGTLINMDNATDYVAATHSVGAPGTLDVTSPSVTISSSDAATNSPYMVDISFDEEVVNFDIDDITITNGFVEDLASSNDQDFVATVYPITDGNVSISIPALRATDLTGNGNAASNSYSY